MTDFDDTDLHQAAALMHHALTTYANPRYADDALSRNTAWAHVEHDTARREELSRKVLDLVVGAAHVSQWAVDLGALGLSPCASHAWRTTDGADVAVQIAASKAVSPAVGREIARAVGAAVEDVYAKFLGQIPRNDTAPAVR